MKNNLYTAYVFLVAGVLLGTTLGTEELHSQSALRWDPDRDPVYTELPAVSVATDATWPPMEYFNREGTLIGFDIDLLREIGRHAGFRPVFRSVAWDGIFLGLLNGSYEMIASSVTILDERKKVMLFSDPYLDAAQYLVVRREDSSTEALGDLHGRRVGAQIGTTGARIAQDAGTTVHTYDDLGLAIEDLVQGRLAGVVADVAIVEYYILSHPHYGKELRILDQPYATEQYGFAIRQDRPELKTAIDEALAVLRENGRLEEIKRYWFRHILPGTP